ncbi:MAG: sulfatase-like hydrolase/transferase [Acidobacteria bacterium]|nr:sulfatase-like hydrolase/transferase [Acidobacteriota bacterium]
MRWPRTLMRAATLLWAVAAPAQSRPNVILITLDTLRADRVGCYGYAGVQTPVLDALAGDGVRFDRAFSPVPLTLPAHCSILTGTYPIYHGVRDNSGFFLAPDHLTLAEVLKSSGYRTAAFVGAFVVDSKFGLGQGFDHYFDNFDLSRFENISPGYIQRTGDEVVKETIRWLESNRDKTGAPFFLWTHLYDPHDPYTPPEPYRTIYKGNPYDGEIAFTDANVGTLVSWLRAHGLYNGSLVVVAGDHGESLGEHGESKHGFFIYNATLHVPLIIKFPGGVYAGRRIAESVSLVDVFPTVLQILGTGGSGGAKIQGRGLLPLVLGKATGHRPEIYAESYYPRLQFGWSELRALITDKEKYVLAPRPELYELGSDFQEIRNLAVRQSGLANKLRDRLRDLIRRYSPAKVSPARSGLDPETREKLQSLGYISLSMGNTGTEDFQRLRDPKDEIGTYNEITGLFETGASGGYRAVIPRYRQLLKIQPDLKILHYKLGQAYYHTGDYEAALGAFKRAVELGGDVALATFDLAQTYLKLNRADDAIIGFRGTVDLDPTHYRARTNLGLLLRSQGKVSEAIAQLEAAIALAPSSVIALSNLGISYSMAGRHADAEASLRKAVSLAPRDGLVRANLAAALHRAGKEEEARAEMEIARKLDPRIGRK